MAPPMPESCETLLEKAQICLSAFRYDEARAFLDLALKRSPDDVNALEILAVTLMETGSIEEATDTLRKCVEIEPESGFSKFMSLGQLLQGKDAIKIYNKGIAILLIEKQRMDLGQVILQRTVISR